MNWGAFLTIAIWVFLVIMMMRGCGRVMGCGMGTHHHAPEPEPPEAKEGSTDRPILK